MPRRSPYRIDLSDEEGTELRSLARSYTLPYWQVTRAQMVLLAAEGLRNDEIAAMACELPASSGVPLSRWSSAELAREAVTRGDRRADLRGHGPALADRVI